MGTPMRDLGGLAKIYGGTRESYREESPQFPLSLHAFEIADVPVTNALYAAYVQQSGARAPLHWHGPQPPDALLDHPVADVSWADADAFCQWLSGAVFGPRRWGWPFQRAAHFRLPSEAEWEHAARGTDGRTFPWGDTWDARLANTQESGLATTTRVGAYPQGASPYGCLDMCGNVWEWTASLDRLYPYSRHDDRERRSAEGRRILRGGCYANPYGYARCACRFRLGTDVHNAFLGFRLVRSS